MVRSFSHHRSHNSSGIFRNEKELDVLSTQLLSCQAFTITAYSCYGPLRKISAITTDTCVPSQLEKDFWRRRSTNVAMPGTAVTLLNSSSVSRCRLQTIAVQSVTLFLFCFQRSGNISTTHSYLHTSPARACCGISRHNRTGSSGLSGKFVAKKSVRSSHRSTGGCLATIVFECFGYFEFFVAAENFPITHDYKNQ
jgi:hypothetical protein